MKKVRTKLELGQKNKGLDLSKPFILLHRGDWSRIEEDFWNAVNKRISELKNLGSRKGHAKL